MDIVSLLDIGHLGRFPYFGIVYLRVLILPDVEVVRWEMRVYLVSLS
jgi:hypothetical protein